MADRPTARPPATVRIPVLVTYASASGHQLELPQPKMRESFTGLQQLSQEVLGAVRKHIDGYEQDFTIMQVGPSAFELEVRATPVKPRWLGGRAAAHGRLTAVTTLDHFTNSLITMGKIFCYLAGHPETGVRFVQGRYGPYYEVMEEGRVLLAVEAPVLDFLMGPRLVDTMRVILANQKQPGVAYATLTKPVPGTDRLRRTVIPATQPLRDFAEGAPFPLSQQDLAAARAQVDSSRTQEWDPLPRDAQFQAALNHL